MQFPKHFLWQYNPQGHLFLDIFFLKIHLQMWQPVAAFLLVDPIMLASASEVS